MQYVTCPKCGSTHIRVKAEDSGYRFGCFNCGFFTELFPDTWRAVSAWDVKVFDFLFDLFN